MSAGTVAGPPCVPEACTPSPADSTNKTWSYTQECLTTLPSSPPGGFDDGWFGATTHSDAQCSASLLTGFFWYKMIPACIEATTMVSSPVSISLTQCVSNGGNFTSTANSYDTQTCQGVPSFVEVVGGSSVCSPSPTSPGLFEKYFCSTSGSAASHLAISLIAIATLTLSIVVSF